jgi:hypothetical protein
LDVDDLYIIDIYKEINSLNYRKLTNIVCNAIE